MRRAEMIRCRRSSGSPPRFPLSPERARATACTIHAIDAAPCILPTGPEYLASNGQRAKITARDAKMETIRILNYAHGATLHWFARWSCAAVKFSEDGCSWRSACGCGQLGVCETSFPPSDECEAACRRGSGSTPAFTLSGQSTATGIARAAEPRVHRCRWKRIRFHLFFANVCRPSLESRAQPQQKPLTP